MASKVNLNLDTYIPIILIKCSMFSQRFFTIVSKTSSEILLGSSKTTFHPYPIHISSPFHSNYLIVITPNSSQNSFFLSSQFKLLLFHSPPSLYHFKLIY